MNYGSVQCMHDVFAIDKTTMGMNLELKTNLDNIQPCSLLTEALFLDID